jgi:hypothetical protein
MVELEDGTSSQYSEFVLNKDEDRFYEEAIKVFETELLAQSQLEHHTEVHTVEKPSAIK